MATVTAPAVTRIPYMGKDMRTEKVTPIILIYLIGHIGGVPHLLLMRRGNNVAYMKNAWSTIAGVLDHLDLGRQAFVEIAGETRLLESEVTTSEMIGIFADEDPENNKTWIRHLMIATVIKRSTGPSNLGVRLDWEHSEAAWIPVQTILEWLCRQSPTDPVARTILLEELHTPDFAKNLERVKEELQKFVR